MERIMKNNDKNIIVHYDVNFKKYSVKCRTLLRFWENKGWINSMQILMVGFSGILDVGWVEDLQIMKDN